MDPLTLQDDPAAGMTPEALREAIDAAEFFHAMNVGGVSTGTWVYDEGMPPNYHLFPLFRYLTELGLEGADCLDIGTFDGMTAFTLDALGAGEVHATCQYDLDRFRHVRAALGAESVVYYPRTEIEELLGHFGTARFDLLVISAMLHHLPSPLEGLLIARALLRPGGWLAIEASISDDPGPALTLNTEVADPVFGVPTLWVPSARALRGMLSLASFEVVSETTLLGGRRGRESNYDRVTLLCRAVAPAELEGASPKARETLEKLARLGSLEIDALEPAGEASPIPYSGPAGLRTFNIWQDDVALPLQPAWSDPDPGRDAVCRIARDSDFRRLVARHPDDAFTERDLQLLGVLYPGETMPEGMRWGLKQLGNLFILDHVIRWGSRDVIELGPGFNLYFSHHLPGHCEYTAFDSQGFYDPDLLAFARSRMPRGSARDGLIGDGSLPDESFDACFSASVLEHIPDGDIGSACADMMRILRPGGWAVHSIDLPATRIAAGGAAWQRALADAGFLVAPEDDIDPAAGDWVADPAHDEPLTVTMRFYGGYRRTIWDPSLPQRPSPRMHTVLLAARKPPATTTADGSA